MGSLPILTLTAKGKQCMPPITLLTTDANLPVTDTSISCGHIRLLSLVQSMRIFYSKSSFPTHSFMNKWSAWVPYGLLPQNAQDRVEAAKILLEMAKKKSFLDVLVTSCEKWMVTRGQNPPIVERPLLCEPKDV